MISSSTLVHTIEGDFHTRLLLRPLSIPQNTRGLYSLTTTRTKQVLKRTSVARFTVKATHHDQNKVSHSVPWPGKDSITPENSFDPKIKSRIVSHRANLRSDAPSAVAEAPQEAKQHKTVLTVALAAACLIAASGGDISSASERGVEGVELLPRDGGSTAVLDYAKVLSPRVRTDLEELVDDLENKTGWQVRVLTLYGSGSAPNSKELQSYWAPTPRTITATFDETRGNLVEFFYDSIGPTVKNLIPKNVFQELRGRYGNIYYVEEEGVEKSVQQVVEVLCDCLSKVEGCNFVPGISPQQRLFTLVPITSGGFLSGAVLRNKLSRWSYIFLFIWGPWITLFGFYPFFLRQPEDLTPAIENAVIFLTCIGLTYLTPVLGKAKLPAFMRQEGEEEKGTFEDAVDGDGDGDDIKGRDDGDGGGGGDGIRQ